VIVWTLVKVVVGARLNDPGPSKANVFEPLPPLISSPALSVPEVATIVLLPGPPSMVSTPLVRLKVKEVLDGLVTVPENVPAEAKVM
jgi:hypothetical protein